MPPQSPGTALRFATSFDTRFSGSAAAFDAEAEASFTAYLADVLEVQPSGISHSLPAVVRRLSEGDWSVTTTVSSDTPTGAASVEERLSSRVTPAAITDYTGMGALEMSQPFTTMAVISLVPPSPPPSPPLQVPGGLSVVGIVGLALGIVFGLLLCGAFAVVVVFIYRRRRRSKDDGRAKGNATFSDFGNDMVPMADTDRMSAPGPPLRRGLSSPEGTPSGPLKQKSSGISEAERIRRNRAEREAAKEAESGEESEEGSGHASGGESPPRAISDMSHAGLPQDQLRVLRDELMAV